MFAAVRSAALDHIRRETWRKRREAVASNEQLLTAGQHVVTPLFGAAHAAASVEAALRQLPAERCQVLVLKVWGELTFVQIGEALELSANTAVSRYRYSINALKKILRPICHE